jgi:dTDP-4-dehydrorhamnose 3,5-epimerase
LLFTESNLKGAFLIEPERRVDDRGFFARTFCQREFESHGLLSCIAQCNISFNKKKATLRGIHYQAVPYAEAKLVRCTMGAIYDVIVDLRPDSSTYKKFATFELSADARNMLYVPEGFAHGFQTLEDDTEVFYQMSQFYAAEYARGVRWDDPAFGIPWPTGDRIILDRDRTYPDFVG